MFLSVFDRVLIVFFIVVLGILFVAAVNVDPSRPFHSFSQIAVGSERVVSDSNVLLSKFGGTGVAFCSDGNLLKWKGGALDGNWTCGGLSFTANGLPGCSLDGQVLKYTGGVWACAEDLNGGVGVAVPSCSNGQIIKWNGADNNWACASDVNYPVSCNDGNVLKWSGGKWVCGSDIVGPTPPVICRMNMVFLPVPITVFDSNKAVGWTTYSTGLPLDANIVILQSSRDVALVKGS